MSRIKKSFVLAFVVGVGDGSISLLQDGIPFEIRYLSKLNSKSDDYLSSVVDIFKNSKFKPAQLDKIKIYEGQGSVTGRRILRSIGKGIADAFEIDVEIIDV